MQRKQSRFLWNIISHPNTSILFGSMIHPMLLSTSFKTKHPMVWSRLNNLHNLSKISLGVNETAKIGVVGDSAGGTIAASLARTVKDIDFQVHINGYIFNINNKFILMYRLSCMQESMLFVRQHLTTNLVMKCTFYRLKCWIGREILHH